MDSDHNELVKSARDGNSYLKVLTPKEIFDYFDCEIYCSPSAYQIYGYDYIEAIGRKVHQYHVISYYNPDGIVYDEYKKSLLVSPSSLNLFHTLPKYDKFTNPKKFQSNLPRNCLEGIYIGELNSRLQREGNGMIISKSYEIFFGTFKSNHLTYGRILYENGSWYEGEVKNMMPVGSGALTLNSGTTYKGSFAAGKRIGKGSMEWANGVKYYGDFDFEEIKGFGTMRWPEKGSYSGFFSKGLPNGHGEMKWTDGRNYKGDWVKGKMEGSGVFRWPEGYKYVGKFIADKRIGFGHLIIDGWGEVKGEFKDGVIVEGEYRPAEENSWKQGKFVNGKIVFE